MNKKKKHNNPKFWGSLDWLQKAMKSPEEPEPSMVTPVPHYHSQEGFSPSLSQCPLFPLMFDKDGSFLGAKPRVKVVVLCHQHRRASGGSGTSLLAHPAPRGLSSVIKSIQCTNRERASHFLKLCAFRAAYSIILTIPEERDSHRTCPFGGNRR